MRLESKFSIETITEERHQANLRKAEGVMKARKIPRKLISLVSDMLTTARGKEIYDMSEVQRRFLEATDTTRQEIRRNLGRYLKNSSFD